MAQANRPAKDPTSVDPVLARINERISQYDKDLKKKNLDEDTKKGLLANKKYYEKQATERANYLEHQDKAGVIKLTALAQETVSPPIATNPPLPTLPEGLLSEFFAPRYREAKFTTLWISRVGGVEVHYLAGNLVNDPEQGVVYIEKDHGRSVEKYKTPYKHGSLKIGKLKKNRLHLDANNGKKIFFDIEKKKFVDEYDNPLLETTPTPTLAPAYPPPG